MNANMYNLLMENRHAGSILEFLPEPDLILVAGEDGYEFPVHKLMMFSASTYFEPDQHSMDRIVIKNMSSQILDIIITSIYGGTVKFKDFDFAKEILNIGLDWELKLLVADATDYICQNMTYRRSSDIIQEGNKNQPGLLRCAAKYLRKRANRRNLRHN